MFNTADKAAKTERLVGRVWTRSVETEEASKFLERALKEGVGTAQVEAFSYSKAGQGRRRKPQV